MKKVPAVSDRDAALANKTGYHTSVGCVCRYEVEVAPRADGAICLTIELIGNSQKWCVLLSPPAAKQIAKDLNQSVKDFLNRSSAESDEESSE